MSGIVGELLACFSDRDSWRVIERKNEVNLVFCLYNLARDDLL